RNFNTPEKQLKRRPVFYSLKEIPRRDVSHFHRRPGMRLLEASNDLFKRRTQVRSRSNGNFLRAAGRCKCQQEDQNNLHINCSIPKPETTKDTKEHEGTL